MESAIKQGIDSNDLQSMINNPGLQFMPKCLLCDKTFANTSNLKHHMNTIHFNEAKWVCKECGKVCTSKSNLKVHLRVHLRVKPYYCRWCDYNCMHHSSIRDHLSKCHPEKSHNSCEPGYIFNSAAVPEPELSHYDEKTFKKIDLIEQETNSVKSCFNKNFMIDEKTDKFNITKNDFDFSKRIDKFNDRKAKIIIQNDELETEKCSPDFEEHEEHIHEDENLTADERNIMIDDESTEDIDDKHENQDPLIHHLTNNYIQQQTEMFNSFLQNPSSSSSSRSSITSGNYNFNNIAAHLFQKLNEAFQNQNIQNSNEPNQENKSEINTKVLDLSIKTSDRKRCKLNENCNFYCSDESPVSPVSSISSSSSTTKTSNSSNTISNNSKIGSKKAISDVINRLNSTKNLLSKKRNSTNMLHNEAEDEEIEEENNNDKKCSEQDHQCHEYKCRFCNIVFNEYPLYSIHAGMHSVSNPWKCNVCGHVCSNKIDFAVHILHLSKI